MSDDSLGWMKLPGVNLCLVDASGHIVKTQHVSVHDLGAIDLPPPTFTAKNPPESTDPPPLPPKPEDTAGKVFVGVAPGGCDVGWVTWGS